MVGSALAVGGRVVEVEEDVADIHVGDEHARGLGDAVSFGVADDDAVAKAAIVPAATGAGPRGPEVTADIGTDGLNVSAR